MSVSIDIRTEKMDNHQKYMGDKRDSLNEHIDDVSQASNLEEACKSLAAIHFNYEMESTLYKCAAENALDKLLTNLGQQVIESKILQSVSWTLYYGRRLYEQKFELDGKIDTKKLSEWQSIVSLLPNHLPYHKHGPMVGKAMVLYNGSRLTVIGSELDIIDFVNKTGITVKISEGLDYEVGVISRRLERFQSVVAIGEKSDKQ